MTVITHRMIEIVARHNTGADYDQNVAVLAALRDAGFLCAGWDSMPNAPRDGTPIILSAPDKPAMLCRWEGNLNAWRYGIVGSFSFPGEPLAFFRLPPEPKWSLF